MSTIPSIQAIGAPVRSVNWVRLFPARDADGHDCLVAVMGQQADNLFVLMIDPDTGATKQFGATVPESNYPTAAMLSRDGRLYIGAAYAGHLLRFNPQSDILDPQSESIEDLGPINLPDDTFPCRIDEDADGVLWIGCYGSAGLTSYDPHTGTFTRYGRMDDIDMYCYPLVAPDGTIACEIRMTRPHVVVFDPKTGERRPVGPMTPKEEGGAVILIRSTDGTLYIQSSEGNYRLDHLEAIPVDDIPEAEPVPELSDGSTALFTDAASQIFRAIAITHPATGATRELKIDYEAAGSELFLVHQGPDARIYGSSILPLHLFRYGPGDGELTDLGACSTATGEAYSMGNLDGKLYICSYPAAKLSIYDPSKPYHLGTEPGSNPRDVGRMDEVSYRPRAMLTGPLGRVWTASVPDYGLWGGPLSWYDPQTEAFGTYRDIAGDASCWSLAWLQAQEVMAVGTTIQGGSGTQPRVEQAALFLWDYAQERKVWEGTPDRPVNGINALLCGPDGRLYGTLTGEGVPHELFVFDPETRTFIERLPLPKGHPLDLGLQTGPDGMIYGFTRSCLYRLAPSDLSITEMVREDDAFHVPGPIINDRIYFARVHELCSVGIG